MNHIIITGASRGLGEAMARRLLVPGNRVVCVARGENRSLSALAAANGAQLECIRFDLAGTAGLDGLMARIFAGIAADVPEFLGLVNNAATVEPVKPVERCPAEQAAAGIALNLTAPMLLTAAFVRLAAPYRALKRVINISSGAAVRPHHGWSCYCSAKAGLEMFTRCLALEQGEGPEAVRALSFDPGIMDTAMQAVLRGADERDFPELRRFTAFKDEGKLRPADLVAERLATLLFAPDFPQGGRVDVRELLG